MMKKYLFYLILCSLWIQEAVFAQTAQIDSRTDVEKYFSQSRWLFPSFETGTVWLKQSRSQAKLNYDLLTEKIFFIDAKGDTLSLVNYKEVELIQVGQCYLKPYNNYFVEVVATLSKGEYELYLRRQLKKTDSQKIGAYGLPTSTSAVTNINSIDVGGHFKDIEVQEWSKYNHTIVFYLSANDKIGIANKNAFLKAFSKHKKQIEAYLSENKVNFEKEEDLKRLLDYCQNL